MMWRSVSGSLAFDLHWGPGSHVKCVYTHQGHERGGLPATGDLLVTSVDQVGDTSFSYQQPQFELFLLKFNKKHSNWVLNIVEPPILHEIKEAPMPYIGAYKIFIIINRNIHYLPLNWASEFCQQPDASS